MFIIATYSQAYLEISRVSVGDMRASVKFDDTAYTHTYIHMYMLCL